MHQRWGPQTNISKDPAPKSSMCLFGIALLQEYCNDSNLLTDNHAKNRPVLDAHSSDKHALCEKLGLLARNQDIVVSHPSGWLGCKSIRQ